MNDRPDHHPAHQLSASALVALRDVFAEGSSALMDSLMMLSDADPSEQTHFAQAFTDIAAAAMAWSRAAPTNTLVEEDLHYAVRATRGTPEEQATVQSVLNGLALLPVGGAFSAAPLEEPVDDVRAARDAALVTIGVMAWRWLMPSTAYAIDVLSGERTPSGFNGQPTPADELPGLSSRELVRTVLHDSCVVQHDGALHFLWDRGPDADVLSECSTVALAGLELAREVTGPSLAIILETFFALDQRRAPLVVSPADEVLTGAVANGGLDADPVTDVTLAEQLLARAVIDHQLELGHLGVREAWDVLYSALRITQEALDEPLGGVVLRVLRLLRATD